MKLSVKNFIIFSFIYGLILFCCNLVSSLVWNTLFFIDMDLVIHSIHRTGSYYNYRLLPFPTTGHIVTLISELENSPVKINYWGLLLSILLFFVSFYLVFYRKIKLRKWLTFFTIFSLLVITYFRFFTLW